MVKDLNILIVSWNIFNLVFYYFSKLGRDESRPYFVGGRGRGARGCGRGAGYAGINRVCGFNYTENMTLFVCTYCDEIYASIIIVPLGSELMPISH